MEFLNEVLDKHYFENQKNSLIKIIDELNIGMILNNSIREFKVKDNSEYGVIAIIVLSAINERLRKITDSVQKGMYEISLGDLFKRIILDLVETDVNFSNQLPLVINSIKTTCKIHEYDYNQLNSQLELSKLAHDISNKITLEFQERKRANQVTHLRWKGKNLSQMLSFELHRGEYIKNRKDFEKLFDVGANEFKIAVNPIKKQHLAYLFSKLNSEPNRMIEPVGGKGYMKFIESKFVDYNNAPFCKDYLNKTASKIRMDTSTYSKIIDEVERIINASNRLLKDDSL